MEQVACDACGAAFDMVPKVQRYDNEVERNYLECLHCGAQYTAYYTDKTVRRLIRRQLDLQRNTRLRIGDKQRAAEFQENKRKLEQKMAALRKKYGE